MLSSERSESVWKSTEPPLEFPPLASDVETDVCIVGAGIAGITTAYLLAREGQRVVVLDDNAVGGGETGQTTAHLSSALDDGFTEIERVHGVAGARLAYDSHQSAIERIGEIVRAESIDCGYERLDGYLFLAPGDTRALLEQERDAARRAGFVDVELIERAPGAPFDTGPCLRFPRQAQFHPLKYVHALARATLRDGGRIHTGTHVVAAEGGVRPRVRTRAGHTVTAGAVVVATNAPITDRVAISARQAPYRTYVIGARVPAGEVPRALYWDTLEPYHYVRLQADYDGRGTHDLLIVGGEDHKTGHADDAVTRHDRLEVWAAERFPVEEIVFRWSGQVMEPADFVAFIGRAPRDVENVLDASATENVYVATGDSGHGMTHGTIAGILLTDQILGRDNAWAQLYDPSRVTLAPDAVKEFVKENLDVALQYASWLEGGELTSAEQIPPGFGAVLERGRERIAAYRDAGGVLHERSAVCTHLGCIVRWNSFEQSWDCPCHGSRYAPTGAVLNGPAAEGLKRIENE